MTFPNSSSIEPTSLDGIKHLGEFITRLQFGSGAIPSNKDGSHDPWDHLEAVMGLATLGFNQEAIKGLEWMKFNQNSDGSWHNLYQNNQAIELGKQSNFSSYIAVAVWHFYLMNKDQTFLNSYWEPVKRAVFFALSLQDKNGAIAWNVDNLGKTDKDYLLTGCSSIAKSIECAIAISQVLNDQKLENEFRQAHLKLIHAIENPKGIFDLKKDRSRFSMDWYYPILSGADLGDKIIILTSKIKNDFWIDGKGIKCVSDEPWITVAETGECSIAFKKLGDDEFAKELLQNAISIVDQNDIPYMGWQFKERIYWPKEKPSWTAAACILAADANYNLTQGSKLLLKTQFNS